MTWNESLPLLVLASSLVPGLIIFCLAEESKGLRTALNLVGVVLKLLLVAVMVWGVEQGQSYEVRFPLLPGIDFVLRADALSMFFALLSAVLWLATTIYAIGYLEDSPKRNRFFGFFSLCVTATLGVALAGNLVTFLLFYELLTLATYPLVVHRGTQVSLRAGRVYLAYTLTGGALLLTGIAWLHALAGNLEFTAQGFLSGLVQDHSAALVAIFVLLIAGLGAKAALLPLHGWLPQAMVAPAPVSALLHAVAVVKAGAFGIVRVVHDVYGFEVVAQLGVAGPLAAIAAVTIVYGSLRALFQTDIKRRLAFSTVSQVSYIVLGTAIAGPVATVGGVAHLVHQGLMKITLFFCAGNLAETLGIHRIEDLRGVGRRMPWTMAAFTLGALGMIGVPPMAGFFSKWFLASGGLDVGQPWVIAVLIASSLLNAAYFLPVIWTAWFRAPPETWPAERAPARGETSLMLLLPTVLVAASALGVGLLASMPFSPLQWVGLIVDVEYAP